LKKIITIVIAITASVAAQAQFEKGMKSFNLAVNGWHNSNVTEQENSSAFTEGSYSRFYSSLTFGYFISDRFQVGLYGNYFISTSNYSEFMSATEMSRISIVQEGIFGTGVFGQYFFPINTKFSFYITGNVGYSSGNRIQSGITQIEETLFEQKTKSLHVGISPGINYFIHPRVAFTVQLASVYFVHSKATNHSASFVSSTEKRNELGYNLNLSSVSFGASFFWK